MSKANVDRLILIRSGLGGRSPRASPGRSHAGQEEEQFKYTLYDGSIIHELGCIRLKRKTLESL